MSTLPQPEISHLCDLVREQARLVLDRRHHAVPAVRKSDGSLVTAVDHCMQARLEDRLRRYWPDIACLGEEMAMLDQRRKLSDTGGDLWCIDPIDGTTNYAAGAPFYAVSVALIRNRCPLMGVVYDPSRDECFSAVQGLGAQLNGAALVGTASLPEQLSECIAAVDFKRLNEPLRRHLVLQPPYRSQRNFGACALEWCWLAAGRVHLYLHGGMRLWDLAAGELILREAGGRCSNLRGEPLTHASVDPQAVVAAATPVLFDQWYRCLRAADRIS